MVDSFDGDATTSIPGHDDVLGGGYERGTGKTTIATQNLAHLAATVPGTSMAIQGLDNPGMGPILSTS